jgi:hypothetical protein
MRPKLFRRLLPIAAWVVRSGAVLMVCRLAAGVVCSVAASAALAGAPNTSATIRPAEIALGESAELTIETSGNVMEPVTLPEVSGLEFRIVGQSRRIQSINGATL